MRESRADYERLIRSSPLFSLDRAAQPAAYRREALKLVEHLYLYLVSGDPERYRECGLEIAETARRCIRAYVPGQGEFLHYFNAALARECRKRRAREQLAEEHGGAHISEDDRRVLQACLRYARSHGIRQWDPAAVSLAAEAAGLPEETVRRCLAYHRSCLPARERGEDGGEKPGALLDRLPSPAAAIEDLIADRSGADALLKRIGAVFSQRRPGQQPLLAKLLTLKLAEQLQADSRLLAAAQREPFFDREVYRAVCRREGPLTARDLAEALGTSAQNASRVYRAFLDRLSAAEEENMPPDDGSGRRGSVYGKGAH